MVVLVKGYDDMRGQEAIVQQLCETAMVNDWIFGWLLRSANVVFIDVCVSIYVFSQLPDVIALCLYIGLPHLRPVTVAYMQCCQLPYVMTVMFAFGL